MPRMKTGGNASGRLLPGPQVPVDTFDVERVASHERGSEVVVDDELCANGVDGFACSGEPLIGIYADVLGDDTANAHRPNLLDLQAGRARCAL